MPAEKKSFFDRFNPFSSRRAGFSQLENEDPYNDVKEVGATESALKESITTNSVVLGGEAKKSAVVEAKQSEIVAENAKQVSADQDNLIVKKAALIIQDLIASRAIVAKAKIVIAESNLTPEKKKLRTEALISEEEAYREAISPTIKVGQNKLKMMKGNPEITEDSLAEVEKNISDIVAGVAKAVEEMAKQEKRSGVTEQAISYVEAGIKSRFSGNEDGAKEERLNIFTQPLLVVKDSMETVSRVAKIRGVDDAAKPIALTPDDEKFIAETVQNVVREIMRTEIIEAALAKVEEDKAAAITPNKSNAGTKKVELYNPSPEREAEIERLRKIGQNKEADSIVASALSVYEQLVSTSEVRGATNKAVQKTEKNAYERIDGGEQRDGEKKGEAIYESIDNIYDTIENIKAADAKLNTPPPIPNSPRPSVKSSWDRDTYAVPASLQALREDAQNLGGGSSTDGDIYEVIDDPKEGYGKDVYGTNKAKESALNTPPPIPTSARPSVNLLREASAALDAKAGEVLSNLKDVPPAPPARQNTVRPPVQLRPSLVGASAGYEVPASLRKEIEKLGEESSSDDYEVPRTLPETFQELDSASSSDPVTSVMDRKSTVMRPRKPLPAELVIKDQNGGVPLSQQVFKDLGMDLGTDSSTDDIEITPTIPTIPARRATARRDLPDEGLYADPIGESKIRFAKKPITPSTSSLSPLRKNGADGSSWDSSIYEVSPATAPVTTKAQPKAQVEDHVYEYDLPPERDHKVPASENNNASKAELPANIQASVSEDGSKKNNFSLKGLLPKNPFQSSEPKSPSPHPKEPSAMTFVDFLKKVGSIIVSAAINGRGGGR